MLMATSPGARGGTSVLNTAATTFPHMGAVIIATFSLPSFYDNFIDGKIKNDELKELHFKAIQEFKSSI